MAELLLDFGDEVLDAVRAHKGVDVEDIRARVLGPLRAYVRRLASLDCAANTSSTAPTAGQHHGAHADDP